MSSTQLPDDEKHQSHQCQSTSLEEDDSMEMDEADFDERETSNCLKLVQQQPDCDSLLSWSAPSFLLGPTAAIDAPDTENATIAAHQNPHNQHLHPTSAFCFSAAAAAADASASSSSWDECDKSAILMTAQQQQQQEHPQNQDGNEDCRIQSRLQSQSTQQQKKRGTPHRGPTPATCTKRRQRSSPFLQLHEQQQQQQQQQVEEGSFLFSMAPGTVRKQTLKSKRSLQGSNAKNNLNDSVDTHDSSHSGSTTSQSNSNFRFTAFPASLPRIGAPRPTCSSVDAIVLATGKRLVPSPPNSFDYECDQDKGEDHDLDDYDYDDHESTVLGTPVAQTRLNFNDALLVGSSTLSHQKSITTTSTFTKSPPRNLVLHGGSNNNTENVYSTSDETGNNHDDNNRKDADLCRPYETHRVRSFASSVSSVHNLSESFCGEENITSSTAGLTPSHAGSVTGAAPSQPQHLQLSHHSAMGHHGATPDSPHESAPLHYYLQMNTVNCSPIPGIPEEDDLEQLSMGGASHHSANNTTSLGNLNNKSSVRAHTIAVNSSVIPSRPAAVGASTVASVGAFVRPMPDMNAFDGVNNDTLTQSTLPFLDATEDRRIRHTAPKLLCPPTPARTPAWACDNDDSPGDFISFTQRRGIKKKKFERQNSLIATKLLATCSPQVLDGRASLEESSFLEEKSDSSSVVMATEELPGLSSCGSNNNSTTNQRRVSNSTIVTTSSSHRSSLLPPLSRQSSDLTWLNNARGQLKVDLDHPYLDDDNDDNDDEHEIVFQRRRKACRHQPVISMAESFDVLSTLGRGTFADVYRVRSKQNGLLYAVKRVRQQFRGKRDREAALAEVRSMQRLQSHMASTASSEQQQARATHYSLYLLFFFQAWQEEGHFYCQTELCCRDTCREMMDALRSQWQVAKTSYPSLNRLPAPTSSTSNSGGSDDVGRLMPEDAIWKICHDIGAGLSYIHSHGFVHNDIKPSNIFFVRHPRFGALCKVGDFGMARSIGTSEDGQEGDQKYMALELLKSAATMHPSADIFSLGMTLYEMASNLLFVMPSEGSRWHEIRSGRHMLDVPSCRSEELQELVRRMIHPTSAQRPSADTIVSSPTATTTGREYTRFLHDYIHDVEEWEQRQEDADVLRNGETPRHAGRTICSPTFGFSVPVLHSSPAHAN